jgi:hypothetical protein
MIWQAVHVGFEYLQREAGYTRTGSHNKRLNGRETGQWHEADLAVAHWLQHTSRDGDMQLHVHSQITPTGQGKPLPDAGGVLSAACRLKCEGCERAETDEGSEWQLACPRCLVPGHLRAAVDG